MGRACPVREESMVEAWFAERGNMALLWFVVEAALLGRRCSGRPALWWGKANTIAASRCFVLLLLSGINWRATSKKDAARLGYHIHICISYAASRHCSLTILGCLSVLTANHSRVSMSRHQRKRRLGKWVLALTVLSPCSPSTHTLSPVDSP